MSNPAMPGMLKIGYTERSPNERLQEANITCTWLPLDFSIEFAKRVTDPNHKEQTIHKILSAKRVNPKREFFRVTLEEVQLLFELVDGSWWDPEEATSEETYITGEAVIKEFLNNHIYPADADSLPVAWATVAAEFQKWKRAKGYAVGNVLKVQELLKSVYGDKVRGVGWTNIKLVTPN